MASLSTKTKLYIEANSSTWDDTKVSLQDDGSGPYIKTWTYSFDKPTDEQLASYETAGNTVETNVGIDRTRRSQYGTWQQQMEMIYKDQKNGTTTFTDPWHPLPVSLQGSLVVA